MLSRGAAKVRAAEICADCGASDPSWASINRGLLLCAECCSIHRSLGRHISHVKSLRQGTWPPSLLAMVQALTAQNVNSIWEHSLLDANAPKHLRRKPQPKDSLHPTKAEFIMSKHLRLAYVLRARNDEPSAELNRQLHSAVRSASLDTSMRLLAQGADPDYFNPEKGTACLHMACRAGHSSQAELLVCWGADPTVRDSNGNTPADCARTSGHTELSERMTELVYELPDRLTSHLLGRRPDHARGQHHILPETALTHEMTDMAKATRGKLQLLPNHLFEELVMDIYDEVDRRETEAVWQTSAPGLERCGVAFLPVNPALSAPRNQGRQKLARLSPAETMSLIRDVLLDAQRRQRMATLQPHGPVNQLLTASHLRQTSHLSDDEPLYDSVASDEDYASLLPLRDSQMGAILPKAGETVSLQYNPTVPNESSSATQPTPSPAKLNQSDNHIELESLKQELNNRDSTISELKSQLKNLQTMVERLTHENSLLKSTTDDSRSTSTLKNDCEDESGKGERGRSLESGVVVGTAAADEGGGRKKGPQRPVSMYETREGLKNNWQVIKHQLTTLPGLERGLPAEAEARRRVEQVTRALQELWAAAQEADDCGRHARLLHLAVHQLLDIFPQSVERCVSSTLEQLRGACAAVSSLCGGGGGGSEELRVAAYELARVIKLLVTQLGLAR